MSQNPSQSNQDSQRFFAPGELLFKQGDPGGDLYFIQKGEVRIFTTNENQETDLTVMKQGEILGLLTCLTSEPRLASAQAKTEVQCRHVQHQNIAKLVKDMPDWMRTVFKEYAFRLNQMNKAYSEAQAKSQQEKTIDPIFETAVQIAGVIATFGSFLSVEVENRKLIPLEAITEKLKESLYRREQEIEAVLNIMVDCALLRIEVDQDKNRKCFTVENASHMKAFAEFILSSDRGKTRKLIQAKWNNKELRLIVGLSRYARKMGAQLGSTTKFKLADLKAQMEKGTGIKFEEDGLDKALNFDLITKEGQEGEEVLSFIPLTLSSTAAHLAVYFRLIKYKETGEVEDSHAQ